MEPVNPDCCCQDGQCATADDSSKAGGRSRTGMLVGGVVLGVALWWVIYQQLAPLATWVTYALCGLPQQQHLSLAVEFFIFEVPKVLMLLTLVVFGVGIVRSFFTPEHTRSILAGQRESVGNILAALLGTVTPFCSCSAVPLFIGFVTAGIPLGVTFSFLISAPMVNEIALVLLYGLFGWKVAALYLAPACSSPSWPVGPSGDCAWSDMLKNGCMPRRWVTVPIPARN